jgi:triacylglycerol lipase
MAHPIVLVHGLYRFDILWTKLLSLDVTDLPGLDRWHYFKGVRTMLQSHGHTVFHAAVSWGGSEDERTRDLRRSIADVLQETGAEKVNIIAHSMGGLDARHMLFADRHRGRIHQHIGGIATIAAPHRGSPFANWVTDNAAALPRVLESLGITIGGVWDLRTDRCIGFNQRSDVCAFEHETYPKVPFLTYASRQDYDGVFRLLRTSYQVVAEHEGENDGLVSVESAKWKPEFFRGVLDRTDHLNQLGWWNPEQASEGESAEELLQRIHEFYATVAAQLP